MEFLNNFIKKLDVTNFIITILFTIVFTLLLSNYLKICSFRCECNKNLKQMQNIQECDCNDNIKQNLVSSPTNNLNSVLIPDNTKETKIVTENMENVEVVIPNKISKLSFYYMNGCGYCKIFKPEWEKIKETISNSDLRNIIVLEENNCHENPMGCKENSEYIVGFPTILLTKSDGSKVLYNDYPRTHDSVFSFLKNNM